jgi:hypothetical protein
MWVEWNYSSVGAVGVSLEVSIHLPSKVRCNLFFVINCSTQIGTFCIFIDMQWNFVLYSLHTPLGCAELCFEHHRCAVFLSCRFLIFRLFLGIFMILDYSGETSWKRATWKPEKESVGGGGGGIVVRWMLGSWVVGMGGRWNWLRIVPNGGLRY